MLWPPCRSPAHDDVGRKKQARTIAHGIIVSYEAELRRTPNMGRSLLEEEITKAIADAEHVSLASALEAKDAEIARLTTANSELDEKWRYWQSRADTNESRITSLERQLAEETERCVTTSSRDAYGLFTRQEWFSLPMELRRRWWRETEYGSKPASDELITEAKTAIRGGEK